MVLPIIPLTYHAHVAKPTDPRQLSRRAKQDMALTPQIARVFAAGPLRRPDILIDNAGMEEVGASFEVDQALWDRIVDTNFKGAFFCAQAAARQTRSAGRSGGIAQPSLTARQKAFGMTRVLAAEWAELAIRINAIDRPGLSIR